MEKNKAAPNGDPRASARGPCHSRVSRRSEMAASRRSRRPHPTSLAGASFAGLSHSPSSTIYRPWSSAKWDKHRPPSHFRMYLTLIIFGLAVRLLVYSYGTFQSDMDFWINWGAVLQQNGLADFFSATWSDRLPGGILYLLWLIAEINVKLPVVSPVLLYKLPANLADAILAVLIYLFVSWRYGELKGLFAGALYFLNPFVWYISALWGQMDAVQGLLLVLTILAAHKKKNLLTALLLALSFQFKPHSIVILPVILLMFWQQRSNHQPRLFILVRFFIFLIISIWILSLPFTVPAERTGSGFFLEPFHLITKQFDVAKDRFPHASVNAFNLWTALGGNWQPDSTTWLGIPYRNWGITVFTIYTLALLYGASRKKRNLGYFFLLSSFIVLAAFTFLTRAHERHIFPFFPLFALSMFSLSVRFSVPAYLILSATALANSLYAYAWFYGGGFSRLSPGAILISSCAPFIVCLLGIYWVVIYNKAKHI